ncbi:hypothetical protein EVAR_67685_1 [Eumeta japonica]|uniref:Uncharacterized protein n=1 Tax=Eumeta variegata TaxID=151549 RepID=A0A4C1ZMX2_EUMVA|nr:hypothetical protein EVAR_67685_1 [Eumeta japonica]
MAYHWPRDTHPLCVTYNDDPKVFTLSEAYRLLFNSLSPTYSIIKGRFHRDREQDMPNNDFRAQGTCFMAHVQWDSVRLKILKKNTLKVPFLPILARNPKRKNIDCQQRNHARTTVTVENGRNNNGSRPRGMLNGQELSRGHPERLFGHRDFKGLRASFVSWRSNAFALVLSKIYSEKGLL